MAVAFEGEALSTLGIRWYNGNPGTIDNAGWHDKHGGQQISCVMHYDDISFAKCER